MALKLSQRKQLLTERKNAGQRITIGFTGIADLRHFIGLEYIKGMMKAASDYDINFINMGAAVKYSLFDDLNFISHYSKNFKFMKAPFLDGIVTWAASLSEFMDHLSIEELFGALSPLPMVDIGHMDIPGATMLKIDSSSSIKIIMDHLINVHHYKKFAFVGTNVSEPQIRRRLNFEHELARNNLPLIDGAVVMMDKKMEAKNIDAAFEQLNSTFDLHEKRQIDAIVTGSDIIAAEGIEVLDRHGIQVPKDVAVVGFNNWYESVTSRSPLTTIDLVYFKRGYAAVELLLDKILVPDLNAPTQYFSTELIVRQSCGCIEPSVKQSKIEEKIFNDASAVIESENNLRKALFDEAKNIFPAETPESIDNLINAFFSDAYDKDEQSQIIVWFQNVMQNYRKLNDFDSDFFQNATSSLRALFLPVLQNEERNLSFKMENIFHQMRSLVSVFQKYESISVRENPYRINNISGQALNFLSVTNMEQLFSALKYQMAELDIPGVVIALGENVSYSFPVSRIEFTLPEADEDLKKLMHQNIIEPHLFPKEFFLKDRRYTVMLEILHHADLYFGYAFFVMKSPNLATYDVLRMLLSNALYNIFKKAGRIKTGSYELEPAQIQQFTNLNNERPKDGSGRTRLTVAKITDYLVEHINEMTDIDKMCGCFMVSRSLLCKKCRDLTGLSVQSLHEKLKIEQAKNMLSTGNFELSEISRALGFKNQNYFSNVFKKNTGSSPLNWLKEKK